MGDAASRRRMVDREVAAQVEASPTDSPAPPTKHLWQLAISCLLTALWMLFLAGMAFLG